MDAKSKISQARSKKAWSFKDGLNKEVKQGGGSLSTHSPSMTH